MASPPPDRSPAGPSTAPPPAVPLYGYQRRWLTDDRRFKIGMFARQTGM